MQCSASLLVYSVDSGHPDSTLRRYSSTNSATRLKCCPEKCYTHALQDPSATTNLACRSLKIQYLWYKWPHSVHKTKSRIARSAWHFAQFCCRPTLGHDRAPWSSEVGAFPLFTCPTQPAGGNWRRLVGTVLGSDGPIHWPWCIRCS